MELFEVEKSELNFCRTCEHRERHLFNETIIQYCGVRKSNLTNNGLLKIKCKTVSCALYKSIK